MFARRFAGAALVAALAMVWSAGPVPPATANPESPALRWRSWDDGLSEAARSKRPVLVSVYTDWCGWCRRMDRDVYARRDVSEYLARRFVTIKLNAEASTTGTYEGRAQSARALAQRFGVRGYPTQLFLREDGDHIVNVGGYVQPERFLRILKFIGDGHLDRGASFETFDQPDAAPTPGRR